MKTSNSACPKLQVWIGRLVGIFGAMKNFRKSCVLVNAVTLVSAALPSSAVAQEGVTVHPFLTKKFFASVGLFRPDQEMKLGLGTSVDLPEPETSAQVDFSETFGFKSSDETGSVEIGWRFGKKWMLRGQYFRVDNKGRVTLQEDVPWGDYVFNVGTSVGAGTEMQVTRLFFGRNMNKTDHSEFGLGLGLHILNARAFINGNATIDDIDVGFKEEAAGISQPLPNFGMWYMHAFSPKWAANARLDWLSAEVGDYDGRIVNAAVSIVYAPSRHFGVGLAYNYFEVDLKIDDSEWNGKINARFDGPYISLNGYW
jgi:hypothetical protein